MKCIICGIVGAVVATAVLLCLAWFSARKAHREERAETEVVRARGLESVR